MRTASGPPEPSVSRVTPALRVPPRVGLLLSVPATKSPTAQSAVAPRMSPHLRSQDCLPVANCGNIRRRDSLCRSTGLGGRASRLLWAVGLRPPRAANFSCGIVRHLVSLSWWSGLRHNRNRNEQNHTREPSLRDCFQRSKFKSAFCLP